MRAVDLAHGVCVRVSRIALYIAVHCVRRHTPKTNVDFANLVPCAATVVYSIPCAGVHRRTGQQVSGTTCPCDPVQERANKVFGKRLARLLAASTTARLPAGAAGRLRTRRLLRPIVNNIAATGTAASSANARYVRGVSACSLNMFSVYVFSDLLLLLLMWPYLSGTRLLVPRVQYSPGPIKHDNAKAQKPYSKPTKEAA